MPLYEILNLKLELVWNRELFCFCRSAYFKAFGGEQPNSPFQPMAFSHI